VLRDKVSGAVPAEARRSGGAVVLGHASDQNDARDNGSGQDASPRRTDERFGATSEACEI
jgi:hypothetical protein